MAYSIKYLFKFESAAGTTREIRVLKDGYSGAVIQRPLGRAPILKKQQNGPVHGTSLEFFAECNVDREFIEFYTSNPKDYRVDLYAGSTLLWQGYITPELYSEPDIAPPYDVQVVATDGVGELKLYDYTAQGTVTLRTLLSGLLSRTGLGTDIYLISSLKPGSAGAGSLLEKTINLDYMAGQTCYEVLTYILDTLHATITWWKGAWILTRETNVTFTNGKVRYFNTAGNSALLNDSVQVLGKMYTNPAWPVGQLSTVIDPAKNRVTVQAPWHVVTCLRNSDMGSDSDWVKAKNARYETDGYVLPININTGTSETAVISQATSMAGLRVPMSLSVKATGATSEISAQVVGAVLGVLLTYKVGNETYHLVKGDDGVPVWQQGDDISTYIPLRTRIDFQQQLATWDSSRIEAEELTIDNIPPFLQGTTFPAGTLTVYILGYCAKIYGAYLDVVLPKGYQDILRIDNGARGEGSEVEIAIGRETADNVYYTAFLQGLLLDSGNLITSFSDANFPGGMDYLAFIARDYALSVALPRAKVTGTVYLESGIAAPPLVFTKGALNYWLQTWSWNLYEDELEIEGLTLPSASLTVESETILESTAGASSSSGRTSGGGGGSIAPGVSMAAVQEWVNGQGFATETWVTAKGYLTGITEDMIADALGYTPLAPDDLLGYATRSWVTSQGYLTGITATDIETALDYIPVSPTDLTTALGGYLPLTAGTSKPLTGDLYIITGDTDKCIQFSYDTRHLAGAAWRIISEGTGNLDTNYLSFQTGGSSSSATTWETVLRMTMDTRRVGINMDAPAYQLDVNGTARVTSLKIGSATITWNSNGYLHIDQPLVTAGDQIVISGTPGGGGGGGATTLAGLDDTSISNPQAGQMLAWNGTKWVNTNAPTGSITSVSLAAGATNGTLHLVVNGTPQSDVAVTGLGSMAYKSSLAFSELSSHPTNLSGYGITDAKFGTAGSDYVPITLGSTTKNVLTAHQSLSAYLTSATAASTYQPLDADLTAIAGLSGTSGFLKKTAANTWSLDTNTYLTGITSTMVTNALGYTPANSTALANYVLKAGDTMTGNLTMGANSVVFNYSHSSTWANPQNSGLRILNTVGRSATGAPGDYHIGLSISGYYGFQLASYGGLETNTFLFRNTGSGGTANEWVTIWHTGNLTLASLAGDTAKGSTSLPIYYTGSALAPITDLDLLSQSTGNVKANRVYLTSSIYFYTETVGGTVCVRLNAPLITAGDQIVISGTPGGGGGGGATTIAGLDDTSISNVSNGQLLQWDSSARGGLGAWVNVAASTVGGVTSVAGRTGAITLTTSDITNIETWISGKGYASASSLSDYLPLAGGNMNANALISWGNNDRTDWDTIGTGLMVLSSISTASGAATRYCTGLSVKARYGFQIASEGGEAERFDIRNTSVGTWRTLLHSGNYTDYVNATNFPGLMGNQTITLSGDVSGSGATSITTTIGEGKVTNAMLAGSIENSKLNTIGVSKGGTGLTTWTGAYRLVYSTAATTLTTLAPNSTTTRKFLRQVGANNAATAPVWDTVTKTDVGLSNVENTALSTWAGTNKITTLGTITTGVWNGSAIGNSYLANSSITINGSSTSLGGSFSTASITAGTAGQSTESSGVSFFVPYVKMNAYGIVTDYGTHRHTISASDLTTTIGSTTYAAYHAAGYVKKDGDTMTGNLSIGTNAIVYGTNNSPTWDNPQNSGLRILNSVTTAPSGAPYTYTVGLSVSGYYGFQLAAYAGNNSFWMRSETNDWVTLYHSGNSNKSDVAWACSTLTASGNISIGANAIIFSQNTSASWDTPAARNSGITLLNAVGTTPSGAPGAYAVGLSVVGYYGFQLACRNAVNEFMFRSTNSSSPWVSVWHSGNSNKSDVAWTCSTLTATSADFRLTNFTDFHIYRNNSGGSAGITYYSAAQTTNYWNVGMDPTGETYGGRFYWYYTGNYVAYMSTSGIFSTIGDQVVSSDFTLKTNLTPVTYSVSDIAKARAVEFDWKDGRGHSMGSIAQDWLGIAPALVHGEEGNMSLAYGQLALVNTILLARQSESHEARIARLEKENAELKEEVKRLRMN